MAIMNPNILSLPPDVLTAIMNKLSAGELLLVGATCKYLHSVANRDDTWMERCKSWEGEVPLETWRQRALSGKALFRLLYSLSRLTGTWTCQDLAPRGGLLYVTWGNFSVVGWKVIPEALGRVSFTPLFEVAGFPDGSTKVELVSTATNSRLPVTLNWTSSLKQEFQLEVFGRDAMAESQVEKNGDAEGGNELSLTLRQNILLRGFSLGPDTQRLPLPDQNIGQSVFQYLRQLAFFRNAQTSIRSELDSGVRYSYQKLELQSGPEHKLAGLWCGIYGPHGMEILAVYYDGNRIIGKKILGDPHVPCNEASFRVDVTKETKDMVLDFETIAGRGDFPPGTENEITTAYKGVGRLAGYNFRNPRWEPGRLFLHRGGNISFLWETDNFVIRFYKLDLATLFMSEGAHQVVLPPRL